MTVWTNDEAVARGFTVLDTEESKRSHLTNVGLLELSRDAGFIAVKPPLIGGHPWVRKCARAIA